MKNDIKYYYIYLITNLVLNKKYVGSHVLYEEAQAPINDGYWGSSKYLNEDYIIYGKENFKKEIIIINPYNNLVDLLDTETKYIFEYNTLAPNGYNRYLPNRAYGFYAGMTNKSHSTETKNKIREKRKLQIRRKRWHHSEKTKKKISEGNKGKIVSTETREKISNKNKGRIKSELELQKLSNSLKGKKFTEEHRNNLSKSLIEHESRKGDKNPMYGKKQTEESKEKNRLAHIGKPVNGTKSGATRLGKKRGKYKTKKY